jgi:hypothetical protein
MFKEHDWQTRQFSACADEVFGDWGKENILYAVEHCMSWRADYEIESYEFSGSLFIFHTIKDVGVVVDYYTLNEEVYERVYQNLVPETLPHRVLMKLKKALET